MCEFCGDLRHIPARSRRQFLRAGAVLAAAPLVARNAAAADPPKLGAVPPPNAIGPAAALKRLLDGNARYAANAPNERDYSSGRAARAQSQFPIAAILSCADSRVVPDLVLDQTPGDLFVVRVAGNVVSNNLLASLEYGVQFLGLPLIMVLGHSGCGAVDAAIKVLKTNVLLPGHIPEIVTAIRPAVLAAEKMPRGALLDNAIAENVRRQVKLLRESPPVVEKAYEEKRIDIVGGVYDIGTGRITLV